MFSGRRNGRSLGRARRERGRLLSLVFSLFLLLPAHMAFAGPHRNAEKGGLREKVGAEKVAILDASAMSRTMEKLRAAGQGSGTVRILHLGDSHIAADYITGTVRRGLHERFGDAGRGFVAIDQDTGHGGRALAKKSRGFDRMRVVDKDGPGRAYGFSGVSLESRMKDARLSFVLEPSEAIVKLYYEGGPTGASVDVRVDGKKIATLDTKQDASASLVRTLEIPGAVRAGRGTKGPKKGKNRELELVASGPGVRLYGLSFETGASGVLYHAVGPLGADAKVYLDLDQKSFAEQLVAESPDLVVLMVGGNDALKIRKGWTDLAQVRQHHEALLDRLRKTLPNAECLVWSPMDAGDREGKTVVSKTLIPEVRELQRQVAHAKGCAFWDLYASMGGQGSITRWVSAKVMNDDLVHPREKAAELLGQLFLEPLLEVAGQ